MRIALVVTRMTNENLRLAAQIGVTDIVGRYPGPTKEALTGLCERVDEHGMRMSVLEGFIPHGDVVRGGPKRDWQIENYQQLFENMAACGMEICCYNFMPTSDWARTAIDAPGRGGAMTTAFDAAVPFGEAEGPHIEAGQLWENLHYFLEQVVPVAAANGIKLAMHPDDPPMPNFRGHAQIMDSIEAFERMIGLVDDPANGICFCQGCFAEIGEDIPAAIRRLGNRINYAHFRDVCGCMPEFRETFHDTGKTDMAEAMRTYREIGFEGPMRPDHVPTMAGETIDDMIDAEAIAYADITADTFNGPDTPVQPGYTMLGRLFAVGYMRGLIDATK